MPANSRIPLELNRSTKQSTKYAVVKFFLFASSLLVASDAFEMVATPPKKANYPPPRIGSKLRYSSAEDVPQAATTPEFDSKVRSMISSSTTTKPKPKEQSTLPNMRTASRKDELRQAVLDHPDKLTVVRFHAPYCAQCKRVEPLLRSFARRNPDIQFIDVAYTQERATRQMVHALGVPSFPYCHVYHPDSLGLLEEHSMNQKYFADIIKIIESYQDGGCDLPPNPNQDGVYGSPYKSLLEKPKNRNSRAEQEQQQQQQQATR